MVRQLSGYTHKIYTLTNFAMLIYLCISPYCYIQQISLVVIFMVVTITILKFVTGSEKTAHFAHKNDFSVQAFLDT